MVSEGGTHGRHVTERMPLSTSSSVWSVQAHLGFPVSTSPSLRSYDVVIVGAGISGALVAEALCDGRRKILIIDRRHPMGGSTSASTALVQHEIDTPLTKLSEALGTDKAETFWHRSAQAVERLCLLIGELGISCDLERKNTIYLAGTELDADALAEEAEARNRAGIRAHFLKRECLKSQYGLDRPAGILSDISASVNPVQLAAGLFKEVEHRGAEISSPVEIIDVVPSGGRVHLLTASGEFLSAGQVIFCTGYEFPSALTHPEHDVASTWALSTEPGMALPDWLRRTLLWEASDPYLYIRATPDGRIVAGGEDESDARAFQDAGKLQVKSALIRDKVSDLLKIDLGTPAFSWAGAFGRTPFGLPHMGPIPGMPHVYACMGYGGNGMSFSMIAADLLKAELDGHRDPDAELFAFPEKTVGRLTA